MRHITLIIAVIALALAAPAFSGKGGVPNGGGGNGNAGNNNGGGGQGGGGDRYSGTLSATPNELRAGDYFDVSGCGYDESLGNVVVGFGGGGWGSPLDGGCFTIPHIPVGGDNPTPGTYPVTAYQSVNGKWTEVAQTTVTVLGS